MPRPRTARAARVFPVPGGPYSRMPAKQVVVGHGIVRTMRTDSKDKRAKKREREGEGRKTKRMRERERE
eukprot:6186527-Pleurochrysis_carterae.AAC.2